MASVSEEEDQISPVLPVRRYLLPAWSTFSEFAPLPGWSLTTGNTTHAPQNIMGEMQMFESNHTTSRSIEENKTEGKLALVLTGSLHAWSQWWAVEGPKQLQNSGLKFSVDCLHVLLDKYTNQQGQGIILWIQ